MKHEDVSLSTKEQSPLQNTSHRILSALPWPLEPSKAAPGAELEIEQEKKVFTTSETFKGVNAKAAVS